jgi:glycerophosphoryl diester phosphodiesterase
MAPLTEMEQASRLSALKNYLEVTEELLLAALDERWDDLVKLDEARDALFSSLSLAEPELLTGEYRSEALRLAVLVDANQQSLSIAIRQRMGKLHKFIMELRNSASVSETYHKSEEAHYINLE